MEEEKKTQNFEKDSRGHHRNKNIPKMLGEIESKLRESISPESVMELNSFERKLVHGHFDHNDEFQTRTYRDGEKYTLKIYPVGNIEKFAREKAEESIASGEDVTLPPMGSYERFIVHTTLKEIAGIETTSHGEGEGRHVTIVSAKKFGRGLKRIVRKIKLF